MSSSDEAAAGRTTNGGTAARVARLVACAAALWLLAGCGFHLQGSVALPEGSRRIFLATQDELSPFAVELRQYIERSGGEIAPSASAADAVVRVVHDRTGRRVLSVSARNTPQEYEVFYQIEYSIDQAGKEVVAPQSLELTRNFSFQESQLLAKDHEESMLRDAMARDLADQVVRRLQSL